MNAKLNEKQVKIYVKGLAAGKYSFKQACESTGLSRTWLYKMRNKYIAMGEEAFVEHRGNHSHPAKIPQAVREQVARIYAADYTDVNFSYFHDCLEEFEGIKLSYRITREILLEYGQVSPERHRRKNAIVHRPRLRRECEGDMLQIDGTPYPWFKKFGDNKKYCICGAIDDATGKITGLYMTENECLYNYMEILRQTCQRYGVPREIYSDRAAIFCFTPKGKNLAQWEKLEVMHEKRTQWQRILSQLNINQILAWSPEAKGRVERMWETIQGQLPVWFYKKNIKTVEQANEALAMYIEQFNSKYSVPAAIDDPFWIDAPENLDDILVAQFDRKCDKNGCLSFHGTMFMAADNADLRYSNVTLCISERGIFAQHKNGYSPLVPVGGYIQQLRSEKLPQVVANIVYRYLYAYGKEISA